MNQYAFMQVKHTEYKVRKIGLDLCFSPISDWHVPNKTNMYQGGEASRNFNGRRVEASADRQVLIWRTSRSFSGGQAKAAKAEGRHAKAKVA